MKKFLSLVALAVMSLSSAWAGEVMMNTTSEAESYEAYIDYDMSRVPNWEFPRTMLLGETIGIPYNINTYDGDLKNVVISLMVNGRVAEQQLVGEIAMDEEMGEGSYTGLFNYTAQAEGEQSFQVVMTFDGSDLNNGYNETDVVTITVSAEAPEPAVMENIAAMKTYDPSGSEVVVLKLNDARVTYVGSIETYDYDTWEEITADVVVLEDASAGIMLQASGLGNYVKAGQTLNGEVALSITSSWGDVSAKLTEKGIEGMEATDGVVTPMELTDDNILDFIANPDWRLIKLSDVTIKVVSGEYGDDYHINSATLGDSYGIQDELGASFEVPTDDKTYEVTGYLYSMLGGLITAFQPLSFTEATATGISARTMDADKAVVYTLGGLRVSGAQKGIYIQNGKKIVVK